MTTRSQRSGHSRQQPPPCARRSKGAGPAPRRSADGPISLRLRAERRATAPGRRGERQVRGRRKGAVSRRAGRDRPRPGRAAQRVQAASAAHSIPDGERPRAQLWGPDSAGPDSDVERSTTRAVSGRAPFPGPRPCGVAGGSPRGLAGRSGSVVGRQGKSGPGSGVGGPNLEITFCAQPCSDK